MIVYGIDHAPYEYPENYYARRLDGICKTRDREMEERAAVRWLNSCLWSASHDKHIVESWRYWLNP